MRYLVCATVVMALFGGIQARADSSVGGSAHGFSGSGTLYATMNQAGDGTYTITGIDGPGVTGLIDVGDFNGNDNQLLPGSSPMLTSGGFAFTDTMGDTNFQVSLFANADGTYGVHVLDSDGLTIDDSATFNVSSANANSAMQSSLVRASTSMNSTTEAFSFSFASADPAAVTPEPTSIALLGTGLLGVAGAMRKRAA